ncbi:PaaI family thioesterase [Haloactinomyces albus]|uniref:Acyl-coenzyme A thioesterase THEM4 n=1 Tax=Haloactinomyces albus TaxID=1352928 RepID=A0AAE3Z8G5_9ACTN|nr:PaaI family thioesterase [Haloactinomyces albus]MDR7300258.1 acyl-coenzyme A thioesterase PaaI-like protein [Haloactinomyces albus]
MSDSVADVHERRQAARELGSVLRELNEAAVSTEVDAETLLEVARQARELIPPLEKASRSRQQVPSIDSLREGRRMYNPAMGPGNPFAAPMSVELVDGVAIGTCTLGLIHEGPHSYAHGGVSALLLDQILGYAHSTRGRPGMTVDLSVRYRRPVPLRTPLRIAGWHQQTETSARRSSPVATIATAEDPKTVLVEAEGTFLVPSDEQLRRLFGESSQWTEARGMARD